MRLFCTLILALMMVGCISVEKHTGSAVQSGMSRQEVHAAWGQPTGSPDALHDVWKTPNSWKRLVTYDAEGKVTNVGLTNH